MTYRRALFGFTGSVLLATWAQVALAQVDWVEPSFDNAGNTINSAQSVGGIGSLDTISGDVSDQTADIYKIYISDPGNFYACIGDAAGCGAVGTAELLFDTHLWLFDEDGRGVLANNNATVVPLEIKSAIDDPNATDLTGAAVTSAGVYYLAVTSASVSPSSQGGQIFLVISPDEISGPDGPGGGDALSGWSGFTVPLGTYTVALGGAIPVKVACCQAGSCSVVDVDDCLRGGGVSQGNVSCDPSPCPAACCPASGECEIQTESGCDGDYLEGTPTCINVQCSGACCTGTAGTAECDETNRAGCSGAWMAGLTCPSPNFETALFGLHGVSPAALVCGFQPSASFADIAATAGPPFIDPWTTEGQNNETFHDFSGTPIPADFFDPGSDPFSDLVYLEGVPGVSATYTSADTILERPFDPFDRCLPPGQKVVSVPIALKQLHLRSIDPVTVLYGGGSPELWTLDLMLTQAVAPEFQSVGILEARKEHCNGGHYFSRLEVFPRFEFTRVSDSQLEVMDPMGAEVVEFTTPEIDSDEAQSWAHQAPENWDAELDYSSAVLVGVAPLFESCGDFDEDGDTDHDDYEIIAAAMGSTSGDGNYVLEADFDRNGAITQSDFDKWSCCRNCFDHALAQGMQDAPALSRGSVVLLTLLLSVMAFALLGEFRKRTARVA